MSAEHFTPTNAPATQGLAEEVAKQLPLAAFMVLRTGDVFDSAGLQPRRHNNPDETPLYTQTKQLSIEEHAPTQNVTHKHGALNAQANGHHTIIRTLVEQTVNQLLENNAKLRQRMLAAKPIELDIIPRHRTIASFGYPRWAGKNVAGLFWDQEDWPRARIALRQDRLERDDGGALVAHEFAHAIFFIALSKKERTLIYENLSATFGGIRQMDEAFAIYTEKEFLHRFAADKLKAPGVYGYTRRQWSEDHLFTRFIRKLYFPQKPAAGPKNPMLSRNWMNNLGSRR